MLKSKFLREVIKKKTRSRWLRWNAEYFPPKTIYCRICLYSGPYFSSHIDEDAFEGGLLLRFDCPGCGCIFGTEKMLELSPRELAREYQELYWVYDEGDTTEMEVKTFHLTEPTKSGTYLNYGAGKWSKTIPILRSQGYNVYGFDPMAGRARSPYVISNEKQLSKMRFDGIISNNLIEHLPYPVESLKFMKSLLKPDSKMVHTTPCYRFEFAFSRFHLFFFTGNSINVLAARAGLSVTDTDDKDIKIFTESVPQQNALESLDQLQQR